MTDTNNKQDYIFSNIFDNIPLFEQNDKNQANIFLNSSISKIGNLFSLIKNKIFGIKDNNNININNKIEFTKNFEELKRNQINIINNSMDINDLYYIYIMKLLNSEIILYDYLNGVFLEEFMNIKNNDCFHIVKNITYNIITNYNILVEIAFKLSERLEFMNEEINEIKNKYKNKKKEKNTIDNNNLSQSLDKKKINFSLINKNALNNQLNNSISNNMNVQNNKYTKNAIKNKILNKRNNSIDNSSYKKNTLNQKSSSKRNTIDNSINNSKQQCVSITNLYLIGNRKFTLKMLKDMIYNIYDAKESFNKKCIENKSQKETLEQFMYTYFNNKYGLRNMVIEWATNIINGIKNYSSIDSEICLFGKILRNELDESCHLIMPEVKKTINDSLTYILKNEYAFRNEYEITQLKNQMIKTRIHINYIQLILDDLYSKEEQEKIIPKITKSIYEYKNKMLQKKKGEKRKILYDLNVIKNFDKNNRNKLSRIEVNNKLIEKENEFNSLDYNTFLEICHEFQMNAREQYLKPFVDIYKSVDDDNDGILNEKQFINLVKIMNVFDDDNFDKEVEDLLIEVDPFEYKQIIFSDCVYVFSNRTYENNESILDKVCNRVFNLNEIEKIF